MQALVDYEGDSDEEEESEPKKEDPDDAESPNKRPKLTWSGKVESIN